MELAVLHGPLAGLWQRDTGGGAMKLEHKLLEDRFVRLEPMAEVHREPLRSATDADQRIWIDIYPFSWANEHFDPTWEKLMSDQAAGTTQAYAVVAGDEVVGITTYYAIDPQNAVLEIGGTYYRPESRGGAVNPAAKRLLMAHAFESGVRRVVYRVDAINARSRAAVTKLGAVQEGILRADRVTWTGRLRDTVIFSILADEWPPVRDRLDARLAAFAP